MPEPLEAQVASPLGGHRRQCMTVRHGQWQALCRQSAATLVPRSEVQMHASTPAGRDACGGLHVSPLLRSLSAAADGAEILQVLGRRVCSFLLVPGACQWYLSWCSRYCGARWFPQGSGGSSRLASMHRLNLLLSVFLWGLSREAQVARLLGGRLCVAPSSRSAASTRDLPLGRQAFAFSLASNTSRKCRGCLRWTPSTSWEAEGDHPVELPVLPRSSRHCHMARRT